MICVQAIYCAEQEETSVMLELEAPACVSDALAELAKHEAFASILPLSVAVGVWGKVVTPDVMLKDGDRLELYRDLFADPKAARRNRAQQQSGRES